MKDTIVEKQTAKLAKKIGFDITEDCTCGGYPDCICEYARGTIDDYIYQPTQCLLQKWLREEEEYIVYVYPNENVADAWHYKIDKTYSKLGIDSRNYETYEKALEAGLLVALRLIKKRK
jgi:hypothetical protein